MIPKRVPSAARGTLYAHAGPGYLTALIPRIHGKSQSLRTLPPGTRTMTNMQIGAAGEELIKAFEGLWLTVKKDPVGVPTGGWGHTNLGGIPPHITMGETHPEFYWEGAFLNDMAGAMARVNAFAKVPLTQDQFDALVSFDFNTGAFGPNSHVTLLVNAGDMAGAMKVLMSYTHGHVNGHLVTLRGLVRRRAAEKLLFEGHETAALEMAGAKPLPETSIATGKFAVASHAPGEVI